ncbi:hypothetical protein NUM3379_34830 [Kineococcus sp. NUM-3379]
MNVSGTSASSALWGVSPASSTSPATSASSSTGGDIYDQLTSSDWELIQAATGWTKPADFDASNPNHLRPHLAGDIAMARHTLAPNQEITGAWLKTQALRYQQAGLSNPFSGPVMERALAYLDGKGRGTDINL